MTGFPLLHAVSSRLLCEFKPLKSQGFSAWLHFEDEWEDEYDAAVANLIRSGCRSIMVTGGEAEAIHDKIDYIAYDSSKDLVLTFTNAMVDTSSAFDFINTSCPTGSPSFFLLSVFSKDARLEAVTLSENLKLVGSQILNP